jgi:hypothetical protein
MKAATETTLAGGSFIRILIRRQLHFMSGWDSLHHPRHHGILYSMMNKLTTMNFLHSQGIEGV